MKKCKRQWEFVPFLQRCIEMLCIAIYRVLQYSKSSVHYLSMQFGAVCITLQQYYAVQCGLVHFNKVAIQKSAVHCSVVAVHMCCIAM